MWGLWEPPSVPGPLHPLSSQNWAAWPLSPRQEPERDFSEESSPRRKSRYWHWRFPTNSPPRSEPSTRSALEVSVCLRMSLIPNHKQPARCGSHSRKVPTREVETKVNKTWRKETRQKFFTRERERHKRRHHIHKTRGGAVKKKTKKSY